MSEITVFDVIDEEVAVLPSFLKVLLEFSAYDSSITKTGNTRKYFAKNMKYQEILENSRKYLEIPRNTMTFLGISIFGNTYNFFSHVSSLEKSLHE
jgi:ABC-type sugar transport system permease subunit